MDDEVSTDRDERSSTRRSDFETRHELVRTLARQPGVRALCLDETISWRELAPELVELGVEAFDDDIGHGSAPFTRLGENDQQAALTALMRARSHGVADTVLRPDDSDEESFVHVVNMLAEWNVLVILVGGDLRPLPDHDPEASERPLPRRLVHHRDATGRMLSVDDATELLLGWSRADMVGRSAITFIDPADRERALAGWVDMLGGGRIERSRIRYTTATGERRWLEATATNLLADPDVGHVEVELIDVHDEMMALSAAKFGEAQFGALTESLPVGVIQVGADGEVAYANKWLRDLIGATARTSSYQEGIVAEDREIVEHALDAAVSNGRATNVDARLVSAADGEHRHCRLRIRPLGVDDDGETLGAIASIEDVTETEQLHARLHTQIRTDGLTGIANRVALSEWFVEHLVDDVGAGVTLLYFDLDGFKDVNDRCGHDAGDLLLREIATSIEHAIEPGDLVARIGGDEFVVARPRLIDDDQCSALAQRLLDAVDRDIDLAGITVRVGCSIGVARSQAPDGGPKLLADADHAMYQAKRNGGRRWTIHAEAVDI